jgi:hypothetical protein
MMAASRADHLGTREQGFQVLEACRQSAMKYQFAVVEEIRVAQGP